MLHYCQFNGTERKEEEEEQKKRKKIQEGIKNKNLKEEIYFTNHILWVYMCFLWFFLYKLEYYIIFYIMLFVYVAYKINMVNKIYKHDDGQMN